MNKGLEVIEAHELFGAGSDRIEVVVHPQSVVHSMVEYSDGATIAQLSHPRHAAADRVCPRLPGSRRRPFGRIDWATLGLARLRAPGLEAFPCLGLPTRPGGG